MRRLQFLVSRNLRSLQSGESLQSTTRQAQTPRQYRLLMPHDRVRQLAICLQGRLGLGRLRGEQGRHKDSRHRLLCPQAMRRQAGEQPRERALSNRREGGMQMDSQSTATMTRFWTTVHLLEVLKSENLKSRMSMLTTWDNGARATL